MSAMNLEEALVAEGIRQLQENGREEFFLNISPKLDEFGRTLFTDTVVSVRIAGENASEFTK